MKLTRCVAIATIAAGAVLWGAPDRARAGILITASEAGAGPAVSSNTPGNGGVLFSAVIGNYNIQIDVGTTNFPGGSVGVLTTTTNTASVTPVAGLALAPLVVTVTVVDDGTTTPSLFTSPPGTMLLLTNTIRATGVSPAGTVDFTSTSNGTTTPVATTVIPSPSPVTTTAMVTGLPGYTLSNTTVLNLNFGDLNVGTTGTSVISAVVPEPSTIAAALSGLPVLALGYWMRRRRTRG